MATNPLALRSMQRCVQQMPDASQAKATKMVEDRLPRWIVARQVAPSTATAHDVEDGVEDASQRMGARSASCRQGWKIALDAGPFGISQVAGIGGAHALQRTAPRHVPAMQNTLSLAGNRSPCHP